MTRICAILVLCLVLSGTRAEWSWGKKAKGGPPTSLVQEDHQVDKTPKALSAQAADPEGEGRALEIPESVLPLEEHSPYPQEVVTEELKGEEGRSGRFLGISDKLCKLGVKGMCEKTVGYPPVNPSHYGNSFTSSYASYPSEGSYVEEYSNTKVSPKPFKKLFNNLFNKKKLKGSDITYGAPIQTNYQVSKGYGVPQTSYKQPVNTGYYPPTNSVPSYSVPQVKPHYSVPQAKPHYSVPQAKPHYSAPKPSYSRPKPHFPPVYSGPKPQDVLVHKVKSQHNIPIHKVKPTKVEHIHTHTHIYKQTPPFDIRDSPASFPRDGSSSYQASSQVKTLIEKDSKPSSPFSSDPFPPLNIDHSDPFRPSQPVPFIGDFSTNTDKRHISTNGFQSPSKQSFQSSIDHLANAFASNSLQRAYPVDCQCVRREYCTPQDLVARSDPNEIEHLLDARNLPSDVLANGTTVSEDYYDYDYLRTEEATVQEVSNATGNASAIPQDVDYATEETPTTIITEETDRVRRSASQETVTNSTDGLEGRQLTGFSPGVHGCGIDYVCCRRPVYISAKQHSEPTCGRGNPSIHGRVSSFEFRKGQSDFGEYPWQAAILRDEGDESMFVCGATLIDNLHVLTAAHCVNDLAVQPLKVRLGEWDVNRDTEFYKYIELRVSAVFIHPEFYKGNLYNDIAVIRLSEYVDVDRNPHISPICLPAPNTDFTSYRCHVTGWGKDAFGEKGKFQNILKELEVPVVDHGSCERALRSTRLGRDYKLHQGFLCAGGEAGKDACKGDGGGPLVCSLDGKIFQLGGIVSWGIGCGQKGIPGVYVNIPYYVDWIRFTTKV